MPTTTRDRKQLPEYAQFTADLIEKLGFYWELHFECPMPDVTRRLQIREEKHYSPKDMVAKYAGLHETWRQIPADRYHQGRLSDRRQHPRRSDATQQVPLHEAFV